MHPYLLSLFGGLLIGASVWLMLAGLGLVGFSAKRRLGRVSR